MTTTLYGIPNCDTVKKARQWLADAQYTVVFHDLKKVGVPTDRLTVWAQAVGWERLLNRQGTSWRKLDATTQAAALVDEASALALMRAQPTVIKRPVIEWPDGRITVGFSPASWAQR